MIGRYASLRPDFRDNLCLHIAAAWRGHRFARAIENRGLTWRHDDTRCTSIPSVEPDAAPILRVFTNLHPQGLRAPGSSASAPEH